MRTHTNSVTANQATGDTFMSACSCENSLQETGGLEDQKIDGVDALTAGTEPEGTFETSTRTDSLQPFATQTLGDGPVDLAPAPASHSCPPTGRFTSIPSGRLPATMSGGKFGASFNMDGKFEAPIPCNCSCGEYRQLVRGWASVDGTRVVHPLCSNTLHPTTWQEDCKTVGGKDLKYGYRSIRFATSKFTDPDQATGCEFDGFDAPGFPLASRSSGDKLELHLEFEGCLVDACDSDRILVTSNWSVEGNGTVP